MRVHSENSSGLDKSAVLELKRTRWECIPKSDSDYIRVHSFLIRTIWECIQLFWSGLHKSAFLKKTFFGATLPNSRLVSWTVDPEYMGYRCYPIKYDLYLGFQPRVTNIDHSFFTAETLLTYYKSFHDLYQSSVTKMTQLCQNMVIRESTNSTHYVKTFT